MTVKLKNNVVSSLRTELLSSSTTLYLPVGHGARFPSLGAGEYFYATIEDATGNSEIVQATARATDTLTVVRGAEGTTPRTFAAGSTVEMRVTAASVLDAASDAADAVDLAQFGVTASAAELNILDGATVSTAELNILAGATVSTAELNILDGVTASTAELNILDGVIASTSELNILAGVTASTAEINILDGVTASTAELNILDGVTASTAELNILDGATLTTTELNYVDGVTSPIQTQLGGKQAADATLTSLSGLSLAAGDVLYATAADTVQRLAIGTAGQVLTVNSGATAPEWTQSASVGVGQTWQTPSRTHSTSYQNTTGRPIMVSIGTDGSGGRSIQVSADNSTWITLGETDASRWALAFVVPNNWYYRISGSVTITAWAELR